MNKELIDKIICKLKEVENPRFSGIPLIREEDLDVVKYSLLSIKNDENNKIAELEAKIFVYEEIIKKSNFAPMIKCEKKSSDNK